MKNSSTPWTEMQSMKKLQVTTSMNGLSDKVKPSEDIQLLQNEFTSEYRSIYETFKEDYEEEESAREDPTIDEYQDMEGKNEDDKTNFIKESTHTNQFADLVSQAELEQQRSCSKSQSMSVKGTGCA